MSFPPPCGICGRRVHRLSCPFSAFATGMGATGFAVIDAAIGLEELNRRLDRWSPYPEPREGVLVPEGA